MIPRHVLENDHRPVINPGISPNASFFYNIVNSNLYNRQLKIVYQTEHDFHIEWQVMPRLYGLFINASELQGNSYGKGEMKTVVRRACRSSVLIENAYHEKVDCIKPALEKAGPNITSTMLHQHMSTQPVWGHFNTLVTTNLRKS